MVNTNSLSHDSNNGCTCTYTFDKQTTNQMRIFCSFGNQFSTGTIVPEEKKIHFIWKLYTFYTCSKQYIKLYNVPWNLFQVWCSIRLCLADFTQYLLLHKQPFVASTIYYAHSLTCIPTPKLLPSSILGTINCIQILSCKSLSVN